MAQRLLQTTDRAFQMIVADNWLAGLLRSRIIARVAARAMTFERARTLAFRTISQIGIRYPKSSLSRTLGQVPKGAPKAGDRFPWLQLSLRADGAAEDLYQKLDDTYFNLLVFGQALPAVNALDEYGGLLRVHVIPSTPSNDAELMQAQVPGLSFYLLRPDGHVGLCGTRLELSEVHRYLSERLGVHASGKLACAA